MDPISKNIEPKKKTSILLYILLIFMSMMCFFIGVFLLIENNKYNKKVTAKVLQSNCEKDIRTSSQYKCELVIEYFVEKLNSNKQVVVSSDVRYSAGDTITIHYNEDDPSNIKLQKKTNFVPYITLMFGIIILLVFILTLIGVIKPIEVYRQPGYYGYSSYHGYPGSYYLSPEQTFASGVGISLGNKLFSKL
jgi:hypothetical protein